MRFGLGRRKQAAYSFSDLASVDQGSQNSERGSTKQSLDSSRRVKVSVGGILGRLNKKESSNNQVSQDSSDSTVSSYSTSVQVVSANEDELAWKTEPLWRRRLRCAAAKHISDHEPRRTVPPRVPKKNPTLDVDSISSKDFGNLPLDLGRDNPRSFTDLARRHYGGDDLLERSFSQDTYAFTEGTSTGTSIRSDDETVSTGVATWLFSGRATDPKENDVEKQLVQLAELLIKDSVCYACAEEVPHQRRHSFG